MTGLPEKYENKIWTEKFWNGNVSYYEPISFTEDKDGSAVRGKLLYEPEEILDVRSGINFIKLSEGKDYIFKDGKINILPECDLVKVMTYDLMFPFYKEGEPKSWLEIPTDRARYINIDGTIKNSQIYVTYTHKNVWDGFVPQSELSKLPFTKSKLENKEHLNFFIYGDSIATGADSTGNKDVCIDRDTLKEVAFNCSTAPFTPSWSDMVTEKLRAFYGYDDIVKTDRAAGASESGWGVKNAEYLLCSDKNKLPDLNVIAFGMNEPGRPVKDYKANLNNIIDTVLSANGSCEFVLVSPIESNPMYGPTPFPEFEKAMYEIQSERKDVHIAVCPVNSVYRAMLGKGKMFRDLTSNNINHPNDFLSRVYAMTMLEILNV